MTRLVAIFITHTPERIARAVMSMAAQNQPPDEIVVSCDAGIPAIRSEVRGAAARIGQPVLLVSRPHTGQARPAQARNNAVRAVERHRGLHDDDRIVFFDGDCLAPPDTLRVHRDALAHAHLSLGWRIALTESQSSTLSDDQILRGSIATLPDAGQLEELRRAARSHRRRAVLRMLSLAKPHKPQVLGCNFGIRAWVYRAVNGMDETYTGWGMEDDDLGRRIYALGALVALRLRDCPVLHQFHPTRSSGPWIDNPHARRIDMPCPTVCQCGLRTPAPQPEPRIILLRPGDGVSAGSTPQSPAARVG